MTSHPEWDQQTTGTEVVKAFADAIKGKNGMAAKNATNNPEVTCAAKSTELTQ